MFSLLLKDLISDFILKIPLINTREEYEVYKILTLPLPMNRVLPNQTDILLKYSLETEMLMFSKDKAKFSLLSESAFQMCNSYHFLFCNPETAFCQTNVNKFCVTALFRQNAHDTKTFCKQMVVWIRNCLLLNICHMVFGLLSLINLWHLH